MANIVEYTSPIERLQPSETGAEAFARSGIRIREDYLEAGNEMRQAFSEPGEALQKLGTAVEQHQTMSEISQGSASMAQIQNGLTQQWNATLKNADPNDPTTAQKFHDQYVTPAIQQWKDSFATKKGQEWALEHADAMQSEFARRSMADMATMSGIAVIKNTNDYALHTSNAIANDPTSLEFNQAQVDKTIAAMVDNAPNMTADKAAQVKAELSTKIHTEFDKAAFSNIADRDPSAALKMLSDGRFKYIDGAQAGSYAKTMQRMIDSENRSKRALAIQETELTSRKVAGDYLDQIKYGPNGTVTLPPDFFNAVSHDTRMLPAERMTLVRYGEGQITEGPDKISNTDVKKTLQDRMMLDSTDPNFLSDRDIIRANIDGELSKTDSREMIQQLHDIISNPQINAQMREYKDATEYYQPLIDNSNLTFTNSLGKSRFKEFFNDHLQDYLAGLKAGKTPQQLLDRNGGPDSIFKDAGSYLTTRSQAEDFLTHPGIPAAVRTMIQLRQQDDEKRKKVEDAAKATGYKLPAPANPSGDILAAPP